MAKKNIVNNPEKASAILKQGNIEHVLVKYPGKDTKDDVFLVVRNKDKNAAVTALAEAEIYIHRTKSIRRYEMIASRFNTGFFMPEFECTCRNCGKTFKHSIKEAAWCSTSCQKEFYNKRREAKKVN